MSASQQPEPVEKAASDRSLLKRLQAGSEDAATEIYLRYAHRLRALARSQSSPDLARYVDAEEMVQSVFGSFFRAARSGYYDVPVGDELWKLFLVIALNKIRAKGHYHRAAKRDIRMTSGGNVLETCHELAQDDGQADLRHLQMTIDEALRSMPQSHRDIVALRIEGYRVDEISQRSGRSKRTVERILQEVRKQLSHRLDGIADEA